MFVMVFTDLYQEGRFVGVLCESVEECENIAVCIDNSNYCEEYEEYGVVIPDELNRFRDANLDMRTIAIEDI